MLKIYTCAMAVLLYIGTTSFMVYANQFIVPKKTKKEMAIHVKEDIAELLESAVRQIGVNISQAVRVQNSFFDSMKDMCVDKNYSTAELQQMRSKLEKYLEILESQAADLYAMSKIL